MPTKTISDYWSEIFAKYNILEEINDKGVYIISANTIKEFKEPRLMAKFDFSKQLPQIFKDNKIGIMPTKNGEYILGRFNMFQKIDNRDVENSEIKKAKLPDFIETIDPDNIYSESNALNVALISGMINDIAGEKVLETIQGKMRTNEFSFIIHGDNIENKIDVNGAAIEIDGGYEGENIVLLIEAKKKMTDDFVIRQLYYPYRYWKDKIKKEIKPFFFIYDNGIYTFFEYEFKDIQDYNSLELKNVKRFELENDINSIKDILNSVECVDELPQSEIPFPQANSFTKIIQLLQLADENTLTAQMLADYFEFDVRQGNYYISAARYLNLVEKSAKGEYTLTQLGKDICKMSVKERNKNLIIAILKHKPFYNVLKTVMNNNLNLDDDAVIDINDIVGIMKDSTEIENQETLKRRASTIKEWTRWIRSAQI